MGDVLVSFNSADSAFYVDPSNSARSRGLFTNVGLADDGPSPIRWSANVGLSARRIRNSCSKFLDSCDSFRPT
jgi:hypothetical protein